MRILVLLCFVCTLYAQNQALESQSAITTEHKVTINGKEIPYTATAGTQPVWNKDGKVVASLFYTYYQRTDVSDRTNRPLLISFNGGPGSASVWMHIAYTGPRILKIDDEGFPVQPYGIKENPHSVLDVTDIVYVNPVNTGYSRFVDSPDVKIDRNKFFGINADISYLAKWINTFVTRHNRWLSPKYIIGESYGATRVSGLALALQNSHWMYLNGVILVSPADYKVLRQDGPVSIALNLPYFTATAWYHGKLDKNLQDKDLLEILPEAEDFALHKLLPALAQGGFIDKQHRQEIAQKMAYYSGLSVTTILQHNLRVPTSFFWKDLLRDKSFTVGRLDSRYLGVDKEDAGTRPDYNAELTSWLHSFTPAINYYLREHLNYKTDYAYNMFGPVHPWNRDNDNTRDNLRQAMAQNPNLQVMVQSGYYDGATTYFNAKYTMWQIDPGGKLKNRFRFEGYRSGHMMYLRKEDLASSNNHLRDFIIQSIPKADQSAKYKK